MYVYLWAKVMPFVSVKTMTVAFVVVNIVIWVVCAVLESIAILQSSGSLPSPAGTSVSLECGNAIYNSIICLLAIMQLLIAVMFCVFGFRLMAVLRKAAVSSRRDTVSRKKVRLLLLADTKGRLRVACVNTREGRLDFVTVLTIFVCGCLGVGVLCFVALVRWSVVCSECRSRPRCST